MWRGKLEAHSFASWSVETSYSESGPVLPPSPHLPWPYSSPTIYFKHPDIGPWCAPCPLALHIAWLTQITAISVQIPSCSKALHDHPAEIACPTSSMSLSIHYSVLTPHSTHFSIVYLLLWTCFVSRFLHQSVRSRKAGLASLRLTISPMTVQGTLGAQNICGMISEWMGITVGKKILIISRVGKNACADLYFSGHGVTSGGPGKVSDFTMWQIHSSQTQPGHVDKHTDPEVQCWGYSLATYVTTSIPGLIE